VIFCVEKCVVPGFRQGWVEKQKSDEQIARREAKMRDVMTTFLGKDVAESQFAEGNNPIQISTSTQKMDTVPMIITLFFLCAAVAGACVYGFYFAWRFFLEALNLGWDTANMIDIDLCPFTLLPTCLAIWLMLWLATSWYYAFEVRKRKRKNIVVNNLLQTKVAGGAGTMMTGFGGSMFGGMRGGGWFSGWGARNTIYDGQEATVMDVRGNRVVDISHIVED